MQTPNRSLRAILFVAVVPFLLACLYAQNLIQVPEPKMETSTDAVIKVLNGDGWLPLQALAQEKYTEADFAKPGTLDFTVELTEDKPVYYNYGWCTTTPEILQENLQHISIDLYFNDGKLGGDAVHSLAYQTETGLYCNDVGVLMSEWPVGEYVLKAVVTFKQKINDGMADYEAGDYVYIYNVTVK